MRSARWDRPLTVLICLPVLAAAGCSSAPVTLPDPAPSNSSRPPADSSLPGEPTVMLGFNSGSSPISQLGTGRVKVDVVSLDGGKVAITPGRDGGEAVTFPRFSSDNADYPRAVLSVTNATTTDVMSPGTRDFVFGADFKIDKISVGSGVDNGDNLLQRGTSGQRTLFKAEVDKDRPSCSVKGADGEVVTRARAHIEPNVWYRMRCEKSGSILTVYVTEFGPTSIVRSYASESVGTIGPVRFQPTIPLSVGGKIGLDGKLIAKATDQFNGEVMNPVLAFGDLPG